MIPHCRYCRYVLSILSIRPVDTVDSLEGGAVDRKVCGWVRRPCPSRIGLCWALQAGSINAPRALQVIFVPIFDTVDTVDTLSILSNCRNGVRQYGIMGSPLGHRKQPLSNCQTVELSILSNCRYSVELCRTVLSNCRTPALV